MEKMSAFEKIFNSHTSSGGRKGMSAFEKFSIPIQAVVVGMECLPLKKFSIPILPPPPGGGGGGPRPDFFCSSSHDSCESVEKKYPYVVTSYPLFLASAEIFYHWRRLSGTPAASQVYTRKILTPDSDRSRGPLQDP